MKTSMQHKNKSLNYQVVDGGWGWMIVLGTTIFMSLVSNMHLGYGMMFSEWYAEQGVSSTIIGVILNTNCVLWNGMFIFVGPLSDTFGWRVVGMVSTSMTALSFMLSACATSVTHLLFSYLILGGIFGGLSIGQVFTILPKFFDKHLGVANAFPLAGFSICQFVFPIIIPILQDQYGYKGSMLVIGGIMLHAVVAAALFHPPEWHTIILYDESNSDNAIRKKTNNDKEMYVTNTDKEMSEIPNNLEQGEQRLSKKISQEMLYVLKATVTNFTILKKPSALIISLAYGLFISSTINYYGLVPFVIVNAGYSIEDAGWIMSYGAIANFIARLSSSMLSDFKWFKVPIGYVGGTFMSLIAMVGFALTDDILCLSLFSTIQGFGHGAHMGLFSIVTKEIVGVDLHSASIGASGVMLSMGFLTIGPLLGIIRDFTGSYTTTLLFMAALNALSVLLWCFMPLAKSYDLRQCNVTDTDNTNVDT